MNQHLKLAFLSFASVAIIDNASAAITVLDYYRLGEADPGAVAGNLANAVTIDSAGGNNNLTKADTNGTLVYSSNVSGAAAFSTGSTLSTSYDGANDTFTIPVAVNVLTNNFGIEAWVNVASTVGTFATIAYNGNPGANGYGLSRFGNTFTGILGNVAFVGSTPVTLNQWVHLALVRDSGVSTFYVNGAASGATSASAPNTPAGGFSIASNRGTQEFLNGLVDEVRVFSFTGGQFSTNDLLVNQVPEPTSAVLAGLGVLGLAARRRRA